MTLDCAASSDCAVRVYATDDSGETWTERPFTGGNVNAARANPPQLFTIGTTVVVAGNPQVGTDGPPTAVTSVDRGLTWAEPIAADGPPTASPWPATARPQILDPGCGKIGAWVTDSGPGEIRLVAAQHQPELDVCWAASVPTTDGAWWVGGLTRGDGGKPAVAVTRDGGVTWTTTRFVDEPSGATGALLCALGADVTAFTVGGRLAVHSSADLGKTFAAAAEHTGAPTSVAGVPVPLLDNRLLVLSTDRRWYVSDDRGRTWTWAKGLHEGGHIGRTPAGYLAFRLSGRYTAFSADGATWRKLNAV
jgi:hypothetical protein